MNILEELFYNNIDPNRPSTMQNNPQYQKTMAILSENEELLTKLLQDKERNLFLSMVDAWSTVNGTTAIEKFIQGFQVGAQIGLAIQSHEISYLKDMS